MTTALKELPKLVVPSGLLGRVVTVNAAIEKATREVLVSTKWRPFVLPDVFYHYIVRSFRATPIGCR